MSLSDAERDRLYESLPKREQELLGLVANGLSDAEIAARMGEPEASVAHEIQGVLAELGFRTRTHAIVYVLGREIWASSGGTTARAPFPTGEGGEPGTTRQEDEPA